MGRILTLTALLVGGYLVLSYATGAGQLLGSAASAYQGSVRVLQGRG